MGSGGQPLHAQDEKSKKQFHPGLEDYLMQWEWDVLLCKNSALDVKLRTIVAATVRLRILWMQERVKPKLCALAFAQGFHPAALAGHLGRQAVKHFRNLLVVSKGQPSPAERQSCLRQYPQNPHDLPHHIYKHAYPTHPPIPCTVDRAHIQALKDSMPCRQPRATTTLVCDGSRSRRLLRRNSSHASSGDARRHSLKSPLRFVVTRNIRSNPR